MRTSANNPQDALESFQRRLNRQRLAGISPIGPLPYDESLERARAPKDMDIRLGGVCGYRF